MFVHNLLTDVFVPLIKLYYTDFFNPIIIFPNQEEREKKTKLQSALDSVGLHDTTLLEPKARQLYEATYKPVSRASKAISAATTFPRLTLSFPSLSSFCRQQ